MQSRSLLLSTLVKKNACHEQVDLFRAHFGKEVRVTEELALSVADLFDWGWASTHLLSDTAQDEYNKVYDTAWDEYKKICDPAWAEYNKVRDTAQDEYNKVCKTAWAEYNKVYAVTFSKLYVKDK